MDVSVAEQYKQYIVVIHQYILARARLGVDRVVSSHHVYRRFIEHPFYECLGGRMVSVAD